MKHQGKCDRASRLAAFALAVCLASGLGGGAAAGEVATRDGLTLRLDADGTVAGCRVGDRELLSVGAHGGLFVADVKDVPAREDPLLDNGGFERTEEDKPAGWQVGSDWQLDRKVVHSGSASMRVSVPGPELRPSGSLAVEIAVKPNTPYRVSLWMRTEGCAPSFYVVQYDAQGKSDRDYPQICVSHSRKQDDWFLMNRSFTTAPFCRKVRVYCNVWHQIGTAWLDDISVVCLDDDYLSPQRLARGTARETSDGVEQVCELAGLSLRLRTVYRGGGDAITIDGQIEDTSGADRAVAVSFRLPLEASGWTWFDDIQHQRVVEGGTRYGAARLMGDADPTQRRTIALYPFSAMGDDRTALALAIPMDAPRAFRLGYDSATGYFLNYEFGLSRAAGKFPGKATFRLFLYRVDPQWGFRSAAKRYYEAHPQYPAKRADRDGPIGSMVDCEAAAPADLVVPALADFNWHRRQRADGDRRELVKLLRYTEFIGWWGWAIGIKPEQAETRPAAAKAWAHVEELAHGDPPNKVALSILNCALHDRDGNRRLHWNYEPRWGGYNYLCNPDPEITGIGGHINRFTLTCEREVSDVDTFKLDGMRYDNPVVFATDNFRRDHFPWADYPLAFDHVSKKPVIPLDFSSFECAKAIADDMHGRDKLVGSNFTPVNTPSDIFRISLLDVVGSETLWTWPTNAKFALQRTLANQKIVSMSWQEAKKDWPVERIEREMKQAMFYGTFYFFSTMNPELCRRWGPLTARLAIAGWEPVTRARCPALGPMVDRFGRFSDRNLHFTLRNEAKTPADAELVLEADSLGLPSAPRPGVWLLRDADTYEPLAVTAHGRQWQVSLRVPPGDTVVLRVATQAGLALDRLSDVPDLLRKTGNYREALRKAGVTEAGPEYESLARQVETARDSLRADSARAGDAMDQLRQVAASLSPPKLRVESPQHAWWSKRMAVCDKAARRHIAAAVGVLAEKSEGPPPQ